MAKRFTCTEKWKKIWFRKLKPIYKCFWTYLCDNCNHAGIWEVDFESAEWFIGDHLDIEELKNAFKKQFEEVNSGKKWFIRDFIDFQYGELNPENRAHNSVISILKKEGAYKGLTRGLQGRKDMDMVKDMVKDMDKDKDTVKDIISDLNSILGTSYKPTSQKTQDLITARLNEGFTLDDFKTVHRNMYKRWFADNKMREFLRPITLYSNKFESYLNVKQELPISTEGAKSIMVGKAWLEKNKDAK